MRELTIPQWLKEIGLIEYVENFSKSGLDNFNLLIKEGITESDFKQMCIENISHKKKILASIRDIRRENGNLPSLNETIDQLFGLLFEKEEEIQNLTYRVQILENMIVKGLQADRDTSTMPKPSTSSPTRLLIPTTFSIEEEILKSFKNKESISWNDLSPVLQTQFHAPADEVEEIKHVLVDANQNVSSARWLYLLQWYSPLLPNTASQTERESGFTLEDMMTVIGQSWFFGFIDPAEAGNILLKSRPGAFLFRYSSTPKFYTLSANNKHRVGHWRIATEGKKFLIDDRKYNSLQQIIEIHVIEPLKVNIVRSSQTPLILEVPCSRSAKHEKEESIYTLLSESSYSPVHPADTL